MEKKSLSLTLKMIEDGWNIIIYDAIWNFCAVFLYVPSKWYDAVVNLWFCWDIANERGEWAKEEDLFCIKLYVRDQVLLTDWLPDWLINRLGLSGHGNHNLVPRLRTSAHIPLQLAVSTDYLPSLSRIRFISSVHVANMASCRCGTPAKFISKVIIKANQKINRSHSHTSHNLYRYSIPWISKIQ